MHATVRYINTAHWHSGGLLCLVPSLGAELSSRQRLTGLSRHRTAAPGQAERRGAGGMHLPSEPQEKKNNQASRWQG